MAMDHPYQRHASTHRKCYEVVFSLVLISELRVSQEIELCNCLCFLEVISAEHRVSCLLCRHGLCWHPPSSCNPNQLAELAQNEQPQLIPRGWFPWCRTGRDILRTLPWSLTNTNLYGKFLSKQKVICQRLHIFTSGTTKRAVKTICFCVFEIVFQMKLVKFAIICMSCPSQKQKSKRTPPFPLRLPEHEVYTTARLVTFGLFILGILCPCCVLLLPHYSPAEWRSLPLSRVHIPRQKGSASTALFGRCRESLNCERHQISLVYRWFPLNPNMENPISCQLKSYGNHVQSFFWCACLI